MENFVFPSTVIDMAIVNGFILFREYRERFPDDEALQRSRNYTRGEFRAEILGDFCNFPEYGSPPLYTANQPAPVGEFDTIHMPCVSKDTRKHCIVCYQQGLGQLRVSTYCSAPQC